MIVTPLAPQEITYIVDTVEDQCSRGGKKAKFCINLITNHSVSLILAFIQKRY